MFTDMAQCTSSVSNFSHSCIPGFADGTFNLKPIVANVYSGVCFKQLGEVVQSCLLSALPNFLKVNSACYSSKTFHLCLPGAAVEFTKKPSLCVMLSWMTFLSNESIALFRESTEKALAIASTQALRVVETKNCLSSCSKHNFGLVGPNELEEEISRYAAGAFHRYGLPAISTIVGLMSGGILAGVVTAITGVLGSHYVNVFTQLLHSLPQQYLRNKDFKETYQNCTLASQILSLVPEAPIFKEDGFDVVSSTKALTYKVGGFGVNLVKFLAMQAVSVAQATLSYTLDKTVFVAVNAAKWALVTTYRVAEFAVKYVFNALFYPEEVKNLKLDLVSYHEEISSKDLRLMLKQDTTGRNPFEKVTQSLDYEEGLFDQAVEATNSAIDAIMNYLEGDVTGSLS